MKYRLRRKIVLSYLLMQAASVNTQKQHNKKRMKNFLNTSNMRKGNFTSEIV